MPRKDTPTAIDVTDPKYRQQGNRAFVELDGRRTYLGRYGSPESHTLYLKALAEWREAGRRRRVDPAELTIVELCAAFKRHADTYYKGPDGKASNEAKHFQTVANVLTRLYARTPVNAFGPLAFKAVRTELATMPDQRGDKTRKRARPYVNALASRVKRIFKWGVENELVTPAVWHGLQAVPALTRGRCESPESEPVTSVADAIVDATVEHLTPTVAAMVRLQQATGMRPGEVCAMTTGAIDTSGPVWTYTPKHHKTAHRGRSRTVFIGPAGQEILRPFLRTDLQAAIFSTEQSERERLEARNAARVTPPGQGNEPGTNRKRLPLKSPGNCYSTMTYAKAVEYGCRRAFGDDKARHWRPNRLRHSFATKVRREHGLEASQVLLGHASADVTQVYAERDVARAVQVIAKIG